MYINVVLELTMVLDSKKFDKIFLRSEYEEESDDEFIDRSMSDKGLTVSYRDSTYKKKIRLTVNTWSLLSGETVSSDKLLRKLNNRISAYFDSEYGLSDFALTGAAFISDIDVGSRDKVSAYIKVLRRISKVKGFSPAEYDGIDGFCLDGNSNGISFLIYDLERFMGDYSGNIRLKGKLRCEVRLTKAGAVRENTDSTDTKEQIIEIFTKGGDIFRNTFKRIIPYGDFYKKGETIEIIRHKIKDERQKLRMIRLVTLIPEKKSLLLAQKAMDYRHIDKLMGEFAAIGVSPVTISKRQDIGELKNIYLFFKK